MSRPCTRFVSNPSLRKIKNIFESTEAIFFFQKEFFLINDFFCDNYYPKI